MTAEVVAASSVATVVGGLLAGVGGLHAEMTVGTVVAHVVALGATPACWVPTMLSGEAELDERAGTSSRPLPRRVQPDPALVEEVAAVLEQGWGIAQLTPETGWAPPALRFACGSFDDVRALREIRSAGDWLLVPHVRPDAGRVSWAWPLVVTATDPALLGSLRDTCITLVFVRRSAGGWCRADIEGGTPASDAEACAARTISAYTGDAESTGGG